jgi:hypothetical protein
MKLLIVALIPIPVKVRFHEKSYNQRLLISNRSSFPSKKTSEIIKSGSVDELMVTISGIIIDSKIVDNPVRQKMPTLTHESMIFCSSNPVPTDQVE